jgi:hypothetical protein
MDLQGGKTTLLWVPEHVGFTGNENADRTDRRETSRKIEQHDKRDEKAQTTHQKQQKHPNNDQKGSSGNQSTHNRLL